MKKLILILTLTACNRLVDLDAAQAEPAAIDVASFRWADDFDRTMSTGFGEPERGEGRWACTPDTGISVRNSEGRMLLSAAAVASAQCLLLADAPIDLGVEAAFTAVSGTARLLVRVGAGGEHYEAEMSMESERWLTLSRVAAGTAVRLLETKVPQVGVGTPYRMRISARGPPDATELVVIVGPTSEPLPRLPTLEAVDSDGITGGGIGVGTRVGGGTVDLAVDALRATAL